MSLPERLQRQRLEDPGEVAHGDLLVEQHLEHAVDLAEAQLAPG